MFQAPDYAIRGKAQVDQDWIDDNTEAGIAACQWQRPKARPVTAVKPSVPVTSAVAAKPVKKRAWWRRVRP